MPEPVKDPGTQGGHGTILELKGERLFSLNGVPVTGLRFHYPDTAMQPVLQSMIGPDMLPEEIPVAEYILNCNPQ